MGRRPRTEVIASPLSALDERHLTHGGESAHPTASVVVEAASLMAPDGRMDRAWVTAFLEQWTRRVPRLRERIVRAPLGLATPAWVPDPDFDLAHHLQFHEERLHRPDEDPQLSAGLRNGAFRLDRPLWDLRVADVAGERILIVARIHHVVGDGLFAMALMEELLLREPVTAIAAPTGSEVRAPRNGLEHLLAARRAWRSQHPTRVSAWRDFARKPLSQRARRVVKRNLGMLGVRGGVHAGFDAGLPLARVIEVPLTSARKRIKGWGGSLNDLIVAGTLVSIGRMSPERNTVAVLLAVSGRAAADRSGGNQVRVLRAEAGTGLTLRETVPLVAAQVRAALERGEFPVPVPGSFEGYATYLPWDPRDRYFGPARVASVAFWVGLDPHTQLSVMGLSYSDRLSVTMLAKPGFDIERFADTLFKELAAATEEGTG